MAEVTVEVNIEFIQRLILVLKDAFERLEGVGTCEITYCWHQLDELINPKE